MTHHSIVECVTNRPFEQVADDNHQATVSMIARSGVCARMRAQARGRAPAPLPARVAMALAPLPKLSWGFPKTRYDIKLLVLPNFPTPFSKHHYGFGSLNQ
jgi:hypothetical protein